MTADITQHEKKNWMQIYKTVFNPPAFLDGHGTSDSS
jgi:hypothetical protein